MKKLFLFLVACVAAMTLNAQPLPPVPVFVENFATAPINGNVEGYNFWHVSLKSTDNLGVSPKIGEGALFYTGYAGSNIGNVAILDSINGNVAGTQRISTKIITYGTDTLILANETKTYFAFLAKISINSKKSSLRDFFTLEGSVTSTNNRGRVFAKVTSAGVLTFGVTKNTTTMTESSPFSLDVNHLLVLVYQTVGSVASDDIVTLYIDPDLTLPEAQQTNILTAADSQTDYSASNHIGVNIRQRGIGAQIGGIRVSRNWDAVLFGIGTSVSQVNFNGNGISSFGKTIVTNGLGNVKVFNLAGSEMMNAKTTGKLETSLQKGLYLVRFIGTDGKTVSGKVALD
jgi:hypothetical protein